MRRKTCYGLSVSPERLQEVRRRVTAGEAPRHTTLYRSCYSCEKQGRDFVHPLSDFTVRANGVPFSACKRCNAERQKAARAAKKEASSE